ncbi:MAG: nuclear transport factor 2 family protein, partial [Actinomycetota bacterium]|nr:nuclear transport factor 2 family protein [Actinomycetota bacterium]
RSIYAAWERGDFGSADWADPEIEWLTVGGVTPGRSTGLAGMARGWSGWLGVWEEFRAEAEEYRELDDERVLVLNRFGGRGKTSGVEVGAMRARGASLFHIRGGKATRLVLYTDRHRALADLGLTARGDADGPQNRVSE